MMKSFIRSLRTFGKTDKIDALSIARFAAQRHDELPLYSPPSSALRKLSRLVARRETLVQDHAREKNRLHAPGANSTEKKVTSIIIEAFDQSIALLDQECIEIIQSSDELQKKIEILKTIDGIGHVSAIAIVALMPELGSLTNKTAASLLGVAPHPFQSGQFDGYRRTKGGRYRLKSLLFMPTLSIAARSKRLENPDGLAAKYKKLIKRGKKPIVAAIAILRNIIVIANARLRDAGFTS